MVGDLFTRDSVLASQDIELGLPKTAASASSIPRSRLKGSAAVDEGNRWGDDEECC